MIPKSVSQLLISVGAGVVSAAAGTLASLIFDAAWLWVLFAVGVLTLIVASVLQLPRAAPLIRTTRTIFVVVAVGLLVATLFVGAEVRPFVVLAASTVGIAAAALRDGRSFAVPGSLLGAAWLGAAVYLGALGVEQLVSGDVTGVAMLGLAWAALCAGVGVLTLIRELALFAGAVGGAGVVAVGIGLLIVGIRSFGVEMLLLGAAILVTAVWTLRRQRGRAAAFMMIIAVIFLGVGTFAILAGQLLVGMEAVSVGVAMILAGIAFVRRDVRLASFAAVPVVAVAIAWIVQALTEGRWLVAAAITVFEIGIIGFGVSYLRSHPDALKGLRHAFSTKPQRVQPTAEPAKSQRDQPRKKKPKKGRNHK